MPDRALQGLLCTAVSRVRGSVVRPSATPSANTRTTLRQQAPATEVQPLSKKQQMLQHKNAGPVITHDAVVKADTVAAVKAGVAENKTVKAAKMQQEVQLQVTVAPTAEPTEATEAEAPFVEIEADAIAEMGAAVRLGRS